MWWSDGPTSCIVLAPLMLLALMALGTGCMFLMMRSMRGRHYPAEPGSSADLARTAPHAAARFPEGWTAFDEYRAQTLRHLDQEEEGLRDFLGHLRTAKDKAEFDHFMAERRARPSSPG